MSDAEKFIRGERKWCVLKNKTQTFVVTDSNPASYFIADVVCSEDAYLIAASPDLYSSLEKIVNTLVFEDEEGLVTYSEQVITARETLAKARGEVL